MKPTNIVNIRNDGHIKLGIMDLAQQNLYMLKRLTEKKSEYSVTKMESDYKRYQKYKKIMCNFPSINFNKVKRGFSSDNKNYRTEMKESFPTLNYINDGYLEKIGKKVKEKKMIEEEAKKNLFNNEKNQKKRNNSVGKDKKSILKVIKEEDIIKSEDKKENDGKTDPLIDISINEEK